MGIFMGAFCSPTVPFRLCVQSLNLHLSITQLLLKNGLCGSFLSCLSFFSFGLLFMPKGTSLLFPYMRLHFAQLVLLCFPLSLLSELLLHHAVL